MLVKVFVIKHSRNIESTIQAWLNANPRIKIIAMSQSSAEDSSENPTGWYYQITIIYTQ